MATSWRAASGRRRGGCGTGTSWECSPRREPSPPSLSETTMSDPRRATTPEVACRTAASRGWSWPSRRWGCPWLLTARSTGWSPAADGASTCGSSRIKTTAPGRRCGFATPKKSASLCRSADGEFGPLPVNGEGIVLRGRVTRSEVGPWLVTVFLSNEQEQVEINKDSRWMFQARLDLAAADEAAVFLGRGEVLAGPAIGSDSEQAEVAQLDLQYRDVVEFAVGHGVGTEVDVADDDPRRAVRAGTAVIPRHEVWRTDAPRPEAAASTLRADHRHEGAGGVGARSPAVGPVAAGRGLPGVARRRTACGSATPTPGSADMSRPCETSSPRPRRRREAIAEGIDLVCSDADALDAFRFANQAMWKQRVHTVAIEARRRDAELGLRDAVNRADKPANRSWRPFQLAFVLLCIPSLTDPAHPERSQSGGLADLLFFPYWWRQDRGLPRSRRVHAGDPAHAGRGRRGRRRRRRTRWCGRVDALHAAPAHRPAVPACRHADVRRGSCSVGTGPRPTSAMRGTPFRLGMWVGGSVSPNKARDAERFAEDARLGGYQGGQATPMQLTDCPWCGREILAEADCRYDAGLARFLVFCGDTEECPFTERHTGGEGNPGPHCRRGDLPARPVVRDRHDRQVRSASLERGDLHAVRAGSSRVARGTATGTRTSTGRTGRIGRSATLISRSARTRGPRPLRRCGFGRPI